MGGEAGSVIRALAAGGAVRVVAVECLGPALYTASLHGLNRAAARLAAESLVSAALASAHVKGDERITLQIQGEQPSVAVYAEVRADGSFRARLSPATLRLGEGDPLTGILLAIRSDGTREVYRGMTELGGENLENAFGRHLQQSVQIDTVLRIGVSVDENGKMVAAGGVLVERLPTDLGRPSIETQDFLELFLQVVDLTLVELQSGLERGELLGQELEILERRSLFWRCTCSDERVRVMLASLGASELDTMILEDHGAEITCHFCNSVYRVDEPGLDTVRG